MKGEVDIQSDVQVYNQSVDEINSWISQAMESQSDVFVAETNSWISQVKDIPGEGEVDIQSPVEQDSLDDVEVNEDSEGELDMEYMGNEVNSLPCPPGAQWGINRTFTIITTSQYNKSIYFFEELRCYLILF